MHLSFYCEWIKFYFHFSCIKYNQLEANDSNILGNCFQSLPDTGRLSLAVLSLCPCWLWRWCRTICLWHPGKDSVGLSVYKKMKEKGSNNVKAVCTKALPWHSNKSMSRTTLRDQPISQENLTLLFRNQSNCLCNWHTKCMTAVFSFVSFHFKDVITDSQLFTCLLYVNYNWFDHKNRCVYDLLQSIRDLSKFCSMSLGQMSLTCTIINNYKVAINHMTRKKIFDLNKTRQVNLSTQH